MFRSSIFFIALSVIFFGLLSTVSAAVIPNDEIRALGKTFQKLRKIKGHFDGGEYNKAVDAYNGEKHQVMKKLAEAFGRPSVSSVDIVSTMGPSDEIPEHILAELKRSAPQVTPPTNFKYLLYKWRGYHDYLWFRINLKNNHVFNSDWYFAYE
ncbi:hypothetical protein BX616_002909 [Lobosporangium transversale]|uniref:RxLR effector protein n=1 Tax=Lobosporangium transversale TaxID=64571 RepID=A0A1Y2H394_9FUNG|nr:hypothetical protein BCR41DRAFT_344400 [Lobosporangium transversale]KAF9899646.1 hypothetical protein BX616_002909 [Lobosporangium transversale]ORZ28995.1 hypothetical protein BCR41DRAFT_344400 [Lobosporangium transversale]|eukprot:XP_021886668.1 hypothetical protein BCR41DRAFT_344400 [Lobosporangium transversale]